MIGGTSTPYEAISRLLILRGPEDLPVDGAEVISALNLDSAARDAGWWAAVVSESDHHGVAPLVAPMLAAALAVQPNCLPPAARRGFAVLTSRHRADTAAREACVNALLAAFSAAGLNVLLLKGAALAHLLYPRPELRPMFDIDLLVDPAAAGAAQKVAEQAGFIFAPAHLSRFSGRHHHLPVATCRAGDRAVRLELHTDIFSRDHAGRLTLRTLSAPPQPVRRGDGLPGQALGHPDMLRHLCAHAFEPARQVRLIHLYDLWRYRTRFQAEIDWQAVRRRHPRTMVALETACLAFAPHHAGSPKGIGFGMSPLAETAAPGMTLRARLSALFDPPAWWLHGFYGVPLHRSLLPCRAIRHPATVLRWLAQRFWSGLAGTPGVRARAPSAPASSPLAS